jgi:uncharacterized protein (TIGR00299 family) protein
MILALLDCPTGLAGNMLLAALLDLGLPEAVIHAPLAALGLAGRYHLQIEERRSGGLRGLHLAVAPLENQPPHRSWGDLRSLLAGEALAPDLRQRVLAVFGLLAEAEAAVHGHDPAQVHFHEVGAIDALVDVVGVCAGLGHFGVTRLICGVPPAGHGSVSTAHGTLPLPAPAVLEIARRRGIPLASSEGFPAGELTTPTGLALIACWAERFGPAPAALPMQVGVGLGSRCLDRPNLLRLTLARELATVPPLPQQPAGGDATAASGHGEREEPLLVQQAQIDDATAEDLAFLATALRQAGAVEVFSQAIAMKKGRQGTLLTALLPPALGPVLRQVWWRHGTTLGVREQLQQRWILPRDACRLDTTLGPVRLKRSHLPDGRMRLKPEHDDLADLARRHDLSLEQVRAEVRQLLETGGAIEAPSREEP